ncbi:MAG: F0F1 ATP synthase subunit B [Phycisphaerales bacterium]|nr:MAG: F0F1 ATP synthase subunit B [Phycisphaerales bacterium]
MSARQINWTVVSLLATVLVPLERAVGSEGESGPSLFTGDLGNIIWSLLTFVVVLYVLGKFAWGPILGALQKREDFIRDSLEKAKQDRNEAEVRLREYSEKVIVAKTEAATIVDEGRRGAEDLRRQIEEDAKAEANAMIERARREIGVAKDTAVKELYDVSGRLAVEIASRIIRKEIDVKDHERLINESLEELAKGNGK